MSRRKRQATQSQTRFGSSVRLFTMSEQMCQGVSGPRGSNLSNIYSALNHTTGGVQNLCTEILGGQAKHNEGQCHTNTEKR